MDKRKKQNYTHIGHFLVEFGYNIKCGQWGILNETRGRISNLDEYLKIVDRITYDTAVNYGSDGKSIEYTITENDFISIPERFFDRMTIEVTLVVGGVKIGSFGYFDSDRSGIMGDGSKVVTIIANIAEPDYLSAVQELNKIIGHEMVHARHELALLERFGKTISGHGGDGNYNDFVDMAEVKGKYATGDGNLAKIYRAAGLVLYMTCQSEINAFIGECYSELDDMKDEITGSERAYDCITRTSAWQKIGKMKRMIQNLRYVDDMNARYEGVISYCEALGITNRKFTWDDMLNDLEVKVLKFEERFMAKVSKMACDVYFKSRNYNKRARNSMFLDSLTEDLGGLSKYFNR